MSRLVSAPLLGLGLGLLLCPSALAEWPTLSSPAPAVGGGSRDAALIVAVEDYFVAPDVPGARANGNAWLSWLTKTRGVPAQSVRTLWDADATAEAMEKKAAEVAGLVGKGGTLWFVFIGHGAPARSGDDGLLVAVDAQQTVEGIYGRSLAQKKLASTFAGGRQQHTVMVVDACFSGQTAGGQLATGAMPMVPVSFDGSQATVLTAGTSSEFAGALPGASRPAFSYLLLGALRGWGDTNGDGKVTVSEAADYARTALGTVVRGRTQTPQMFGPGSFVLTASARERGPDLAAHLAAGPVKVGGFGRGLEQIGSLADVTSLDLAMPTTSLSDVDTDLMDLVLEARNSEQRASVSLSERAAAWGKVADYKGGRHSLAARAKARALEWNKAAKTAAARKKKLKKVAAQMAQDQATLDKLLGYPDDMVSQAQKDAYRREFDRVYTPWRSELNRSGHAPAPAPGALAPRGFVRVEAGSFSMGSPTNEPGRGADEPQHTVRITRPYFMQTTEVTQSQYGLVMGSNPSKYRGCGGQCPVEQVSWFDAVGYANALSKKEGLPACYSVAGDHVTFHGLSCLGYRLPTEAEWEYAARAGSRHSTTNGDMTVVAARNAPQLQDIAWYGGNSGVSYSDGLDCSAWVGKAYTSSKCGPHPVAGKRANAWGLYDMQGNVWEWTHDWRADYPTGSVVDPQGPGTGTARVTRGGSWGNEATWTRLASRPSSEPKRQLDNLGFRVARTAR